MNTALRRILHLGLVPAFGLLALTASTSITHAQGPGSHPPIVNTSPATLASLEGGTSIGPGDMLKLDGSNFGANGLVCVTWSQTVYDSAFDTGGHFCFSGLDWQPTRIVAQVPADIDGVTQQTVQIAVFSNQHGESNALDLTFTPTLVVAQVFNSPTLGQPLTISCGRSADTDTNLCGADSAYHSRPGCAFYAIACFSPDELGTDTYSLHLAHGWGFVSAALGVPANQGEADVASEPSPLTASGAIVVNWDMFSGEDQLSYTITITAYGPKGVPFTD